MNDAEWLTELADKIYARGIRYPISAPLNEIGITRLRAIASRLTPPEPSVEEVPTPTELNRYRNDVIFHDLVMRFRSYVDGGLGKYEDIIAAAQFGRKIHWNESAQLAAKLREEA